MAWNRMFGKKKKKEELDPFQDLVLSKLKVGYLVDYDLKTWKVTEYNKYDWGNGDYSYEWELTSGNEVVYLECEDDDEPEWVLAKKIPFKKLGPGLGKHIREKEDPPNEIEYDGVIYYLEDGSGGYFCKGGGEQKTEFLYWDFLDESEEKILTIEQWEEDKFEASVGKYVEEYQFTNILPG
ncbi:MAG: hypothetical protein SCARUB_02314 [Candidatus Scalindua rubra]|uniref:DUF4178 domain-containing protein n=1 Tax=Candidatus Scalindua rubra TaxID=1872076 RepID=A0A1E3XAD7_9BACT|nr:MAG: hypothetical protein SCARUB_02314 [Candidatus Scalindua rubra]